MAEGNVVSLALPIRRPAASGRPPRGGYRIVGGRRCTGDAMLLLRSLALLLVAACAPNEVGDDPCRVGPCGPGEGWIAYVARASGEDEVWLVRDDGSRSARVTNESLSGDLGGGRLLNPKFSWDGSQIAVHAGVGPDGVSQVSSIWVVQSAGSELHHLFEIGPMFTVSWSGDSKYLYGPEPGAQCSTSLVRAEAAGVDGFETLYSAEAGGVSSPLVRPTDPNEVLFSDLPCATGEGALLLDVQRGTTEALPMLDDILVSAWSADGSRIAGTRDGDLVVAEFDARRIVQEFSAAEGGYAFPQFAGSNDRIVARKTASTIPRIALIDLEAQTEYVVETPHDISITAASWAVIASDPDRDSDGLCNGIDPAPDDAS